MGTLEALLRGEGVRVPRPLLYCTQKGGAPDRVPLLERILSGDRGGRLLYLDACEGESEVGDEIADIGPGFL